MATRWGGPKKREQQESTANEKMRIGAVGGGAVKLVISSPTFRKGQAKRCVGTERAPPNDEEMRYAAAELFGETQSPAPVMAGGRNYEEDAFRSINEPVSSDGIGGQKRTTRSSQLRIGRSGPWKHRPSMSKNEKQSIWAKMVAADRLESKSRGDSRGNVIEHHRNSRDQIVGVHHVKR